MKIIFVWLNFVIQLKLMAKMTSHVQKKIKLLKFQNVA